MNNASTVTRSRKSTPCRLYAQGYCRFGDNCKFGHDATDMQSANAASKHSDHSQPHFSTTDSTSPTPSHDSSDNARRRPKRGEVPCRTWAAGTCTKGSRCWFRHDIDVPEPGLEPSRSHEPKQLSETSRPPTEQDPSSLSTPDLNTITNTLETEVQETKARVARERANAIAREEAAKTISQVVFGSIVTFSAGLDVGNLSNLVTGFETCTLRLGNLPLHVKDQDIHALIEDQGVDVGRVHLVIRKKWDNKREVRIVTDTATGRTLTSSLDGIEFQEETLVVEMSAANTLEGMNVGTGQSSDVLTISWHAPSVRYVAEYVDIAAAKSMVKALHCLPYAGRRIKVEMNAQPRGRYVPNLRLNAIKISNLPPSVTDEDVVGFTGSTSVKRLRTNGSFITYCSTEQIACQVRQNIELAVPGGLKKFDDPPNACTLEGIVSARAYFSSWDDAHTAYTHLSDKRFGNQTIWLRLPDPMHFTLVVPVEQYRAQKEQWDSLSGSIKDRSACSLSIHDAGNVVLIRLSGSVKEATGALKVRVESLARGEKVEGWHRSLGVPSNPFVLRVYSETGAYLRADGKKKSLKVYGSSSAVDHAREMVKGELERLASMDYTITLARHSVGFFVREGLQQLKETLGENNVRFTMSSRKITVSGGEEARHALDRLLALSHGDHSHSFPSVSQDIQTCPVCYEDVSSPHQLSCGHAYCATCLRHFISSASDSDQLPLTCLGNEAQCRVPIPIPTIQQFLPAASFNRLIEAAFDAYIAKHPDVFKHCKTPDCMQIYRAAQTGAVPQILHCPSCFSTVCNGCHEDAHDGLSCAESKARRDPAEQERLNDIWIASQGGRVKRCPQCSVPIEKLQGCNHMTCRCGAHICWRCMGIFTAETIYNHMRTAHGTIHGDAPHVPEPPVNIGIEVDIEEQRELFRRLETLAAVQNANNGAHLAQYRPFEDGAHGGLEEEEGGGMLGRVARWRRQQEMEGRDLRIRALGEAEERQLIERVEQERLETEERLRRGVEEWRRREERRQGRWGGCMIM